MSPSPADPETVIDVRHLTKRFGDRTVVDDVSLKVRRGEVVGFLGPNGSGKTTTIRMICGLLRLDAGEGEVLGFDLRTGSREIKARLGYMTQRFSLYEDPLHRGEPRPRRRALPPARPARGGRRDARLARPHLAPPPARGLALRRLEAAPGAGRLHHARSPSSCSSTSRRRASTPRRGASSGTRSTA